MKPSDILRKAAELIADKEISDPDDLPPEFRRSMDFGKFGAMIDMKKPIDMYDKEDRALTIGWMMHQADKMDGLI